MSDELRQRPSRWRLSGFVNAVRTTFVRSRRARGARSSSAPAQDGLWQIPTVRGPAASPLDPADGVDATDDHDLNWLFPPDTVTDAAAWDKYWGDEVRHGVQGLTDMLVLDGELVDAMRANGLKTVLCVGSGASMEPRALAYAGFTVTALDLSLLAMAYARDAHPTPEQLSRLIEGRAPRFGGSVDFVTGDLTDPTVCAGPFDVIIERRTLQLWPEDQRAAAAHAVTHRLASRGLFVSQFHDGGWKPDDPLVHPLDAWFADRTWPQWHRELPLIGRAWWRLITTG